MPALVYNGTVIAERAEMLSLTDMWRAAGGDLNYSPAEWARQSDAQRFAEFLRLSANMGDAHIIETRRGRGGGTWAHWQLALAYAKYLSPAFHAWCNEVVRERMEGAPAVSAAIPHGGPVDLSRDARAAVGGMPENQNARIPGLRSFFEGKSSQLRQRQLQS